MTLHRRQNTASEKKFVENVDSVESVDTPFDSIDTNDVSGDSDYDECDEQMGRKKTWDNNYTNDKPILVTRSAKIFLLKLLTIPLTAYLLTFGVWLYRSNFTSSIVVYTMGKDLRISGAMYEPVSFY